MNNSTLIINGNNSPISDKRLIDSFLDNGHEKIFFLHKDAKPKTFNNKEILVRIFANDTKFTFTNCTKVFIIESLTGGDFVSVNDVFFETELIINSIRNRNQKTKIYLIATDFGYSRQDRALNKVQEIEGQSYETAEPEALKLRVNSLYNAGLSKLMVFNSHSNVLEETCKKLQLEFEQDFGFKGCLGKIFLQIITVEDGNVKLFFEFFDNKNCYVPGMCDISEETFEKIINFFNNDLVLVAPDMGSTKRVEELADSIHKDLKLILKALDISLLEYDLSSKLKPRISVTTIKKVRTAPGESSVAEIDGYVRNKCCLIIDDILDTGGTLCNAAEALMNTQQAKSVYCFITHGVLSKNAVEKLNSSIIKKVHLTNSVTSVYKKTSGHNKFEIHDLFTIIKKFIDKESCK